MATIATEQARPVAKPVANIPPFVHFYVHLDADTYESLRAVALERNMDVETLAAILIVDNKDRGGDRKPVYLDDSQRREIERLIGNNLDSTDPAASLLRNLRLTLSLRISTPDGPLEIPVTGELYRRITTRVLPHQDIRDVVEGVVRLALEEFTGMR